MNSGENRPEAGWFLTISLHPPPCGPEPAGARPLNPRLASNRLVRL
jgi:hypothetical protein